MLNCPSLSSGFPATESSLTSDASSEDPHHVHIKKESMSDPLGHSLRPSVCWSVSTEDSTSAGVNIPPDRREKNNRAAQRSRKTRKEREDKLALSVQQLQERNLHMIKTIAAMLAESSYTPETLHDLVQCLPYYKPDFISDAEFSHIIARCLQEQENR